MGEYLYTGAWQLCGQKGKDCFGMVAGIIQLSGYESIRFSFDALKVYVEDDKDEFAIELPEAWARVLAEELSAVLVRSDHLYKLYRQGQLASHAVYSEETDRSSLASEHTDSHSANLTAKPVARKTKSDVQAEIQIEKSLVIYDHQDHTEVGSVSAFGFVEGSGAIQIRLSKEGIRRIPADDYNFDIEIPRSIGEVISLQLREVAVKLEQLRSLKRRGFLLDML